MFKLSKKLIPFIIICFFSCDDDKNDNIKEKPEKSKYEKQEEKRKTLDSVNILEEKKLIETLSAVKDWDSTNSFTYLLQEKFANNSNPISFVGVINDIYIR